MLKKMLLTTLFMLSGVLLFAALPSKTIEIEGFGETIDAAMKNARVNAIRKAFGEVVDSVTETKNEELIESTISASSGFIVSSELIGQPKYDTTNKCYTVKLRTVVATERLKDHITRFKKNKTEVDMLSQLKASDDAETQEKNAMKIVRYLAEETPKTLRLVKNYKIDIEKNLTFQFELTHDQTQLAKMYEDAVKILRANGYVTNEKLATYTRLRNGYRDFEGSVIEIGETAYNNTEAILYANAYYHKNEPRNAWPLLPRAEICIELRDKQSKILSSSSTDNGLFLSCYANNVDAGPTERRTLSWFIFHNESYVENRRWNCDFQNVSSEQLKNVDRIVILVDQGKQIGKKIVIAEIPLKGEDLFAQAESKKNRMQQYSALLAKFNQEYHKSIQPKAKFKYDRYQNVGKVTINLSINKREFVKASRKLSSQLEKLGLNIKEGLGYETQRYHVNLRIGNWHVQIPDTEGLLSEAMDKDLFKSRYSLVLEFKDKTGELLQKKSFDLPRAITPTTNHYWRKTTDTYEATGDYSCDFENSVNFDIPEDLKEVATVECHIEERTEQ